MKKSKTVISIALSFFLFSMSSCGDNTSSSAVTEKNVTMKLSVTASKTEYDQYETFSYSSLKVDSLKYVDGTLADTSENIKDFVVVDSKGNVIHDNDKLNPDTFGEGLEYFVTKDGYERASFTLTINKAKKFSQTLMVTAPSKSNYKIGEKVDLSGLTVQVETSYYTGTENYKKRIDTLTDAEYKIDVNGESVDSFVIDGYGVFTVNISYTSFSSVGQEKILHSEFYLYCAHENISSEPVDYSDRTDNDWVDDDRTVTIQIQNKNKNNTDKGYLSPDEISTPKNLFDYGQNNAQNWQYSPGTGNVPFLIIPVVIPGYDSLATGDLWNTINNAFFADSNDIPFESLRSYYSKSSHGKLNITGTVTDYFFPERETDDFNTYFDFANPNKQMEVFIEEALEWAKTTYDLDLTKYDSDHNGIIDGAWFVYVYDKKSTDVMNFWAYSSTTGITGTPENPKINNFGWLGSTFLTESLGEDKGNDGHVIIHESGHMFGLSDYYSYNQSVSDRYAPLGRADMMDNNCSDQNPFSKMMMGWQKPYVVTGNCTITLKADQNLDQCILIPYDEKDYSKAIDKDTGLVDINLFDEYLLVDFYTDKNLNEKGYEQYYVDSIKGYGVRIYHVDNRLAKVSVRRQDDTYESELVSAEEGLELLGENNHDIIKAISNTESGERSESTRFGLPSSANYYDEVRLIYADKSYASYNNYAKTSSLFAPNGDLSKNSTFSIEDYKSQFVNGKFDSEKDFNYTVNILNY